MNKPLKYSCFLVSFVLLSVALQAQSLSSWKITDLEQYIQRSNKPVIISFWATYCKPCLQEIPYLEEAIVKYKKEGVTVLLVSLDMKEQYPKDITRMIRNRKFSSKTVWLNETNADYFCPKVDTAWSGALPATLFINNGTGYRKFFEEELSKEKLEKEIMEMVGRQ